MEEIKINNTFAKGNNPNCTHKWIYKNERVLLFEYPPRYLNQRICEECGRLEVVESNFIIKCENDKFCEIRNNFNKGATKD